LGLFIKRLATLRGPPKVLVGLLGKKKGFLFDLDYWVLFNLGNPYFEEGVNWSSPNFLLKNPFQKGGFSKSFKFSGSHIGILGVTDKEERQTFQFFQFLALRGKELTLNEKNPNFWGGIAQAAVVPLAREWVLTHRL